MIKSPLLTVALLAAGQSALAQVPAGGQLRQIPPAATQPRSIPDLRTERGAPPAGPIADGLRVPIRTVRLTGATRFGEAQLVAASGFQPGEFDLAALRALAARITDFYNRQGYFVAQAYLPAQDVQDGALTIAVIEGRYGKIALDNRAPVSDGLARALLAGLDPGDLVANAPLERRLLLLSDLPAVGVAATLTPGDTVGSSDLLVALTPGRRVTGVLEADNAGSRYTGEWRAGATVNFNEPLGLGDVASLRLLTAGEGLNYGRAAYQAQLQTLTIGAAYTYLEYRLGEEFSALDASGAVGVASLYASYPLIRSRRANLYGLLNLDAKTFEDRFGAAGTQSDRSARVVTAGLSGDREDSLWAGGRTTFAVYGAFGDLDIETPSVRAADALTARTHGAYRKLLFEVTRAQFTGGPLSLHGALRGQLASKNLDSSEKMELGGAYGVRAYPEGEGYGDQGYIATAEARLRLAALSEFARGEVQAFAFVDQGAVTLNKSPWEAGPNKRDLGAVGLGLMWAGAPDLVVKVTYAVKLGDEPAISAPDRSGRVWFQITKFL